MDSVLPESVGVPFLVPIREVRAEIGRRGKMSAHAPL